MTQTDTDYTDDLDDDDGSGLVGDLRKQLRAANKRLKDMEAQANQNQAAARRVAFIDAGIDLSTPAMRFYSEHYAGDLDPEAIKADALANGFLTETDHSNEISEVAGQSEAVAGGEGPPAFGDMEEFSREIDEAVRKAPRGKEAQAIDEVYQRFKRTV
jgi:hypothetical protein